MEATAKDFRTWHATVLAAAALARAETGDTVAAHKRAVSAAMQEVAAFLGNTPNLARNSYVDPRVIDAFRSGRTISLARGDDDPGVRQAVLEKATLKLLSDS